MSDKSRAKKLAAAKKKLKEYHGTRDKKILNEPDDNGSVDILLEENNVKESSIEHADFDLIKGKCGDGNSDVIETLISEKANILAQLVKIETMSKAKDMEIEELNAQLIAANRRIKNFDKCVMEKSVENDDLKIVVQEIRNELNKSEEYIKMTKSQQEEQTDYVEGIKSKINIQKRKFEELESELKEKTYKLELNKIQLNQLSDEAQVTIDNKEIIEQLRKEKNESNQQYQSYIQNLSKNLSVMTENNLQLKEENAKLSDRENHLVQHIQELEKQMRTRTSEKIVRVQNYNQKQFNRRRKPPFIYKEGDLVMITNIDTTPSVSKKLIPRYKGPYVVSKILGHDRYLIRDIEGFQITQRPFEGVYDVSRMKLWSY